MRHASPLYTHTQVDQLRSALAASQEAVGRMRDLSEAVSRIRSAGSLPYDGLGLGPALHGPAHVHRLPGLAQS